MTYSRWLSLTCVAAASACGAAQTSGPAELTPPADPPSAAPPAPPPAAVDARGAENPVPSTQGAAHRLVIDAVACWLGGVWSDAHGVPETARAADAEQRCHALVAHAYGADDPIRYERLRAVEAVEVSELEDKVLAAAQNDVADAERWANLARLLQAAANTEREDLFARRAGDRVKMDLDGERQPGQLSADELAAVAPLRQSKAFETLLHSDIGDLSHEARTIAILAAMDRMEVARGLSKHLKLYVLEKPYQSLFGVAAPDMPRDPRTPLKPGAWLAYISTVAQAAGHPVPERAHSPTDRELLAWGGALAGLADQLRTEITGLSDTTELKGVAQAVVQRLDREYRGSEAAVLLEPEPARRAASGVRTP